MCIYTVRFDYTHTLLWRAEINVLFSVLVTFLLAVTKCLTKAI